MVKIKMFKQKTLSRHNSRQSSISAETASVKSFKSNGSAGDYYIGSSATVSRQPSAKRLNGLNKRASQDSSDNAVGQQQPPTNILNVAEMLLHGVADNEILDIWLKSIQCDEFVAKFIDAGYDMPTLSKITPQDLTAIGVREPTKRLKILTEIKKLNLQDGLPNFIPANLSHWLSLIRLDSYYYKSLCDQKIDTIEKMCQLTWEDFEEIGITKLGHQKRLQLAIERMRELEADEKSTARSAAEPIYDTNPSQILLVASAENHCRILTGSARDRGSSQTLYNSASSGDSYEHSLNVYNSNTINYPQASSGVLNRRSTTTTASSCTLNDANLMLGRQRSAESTDSSAGSTPYTHPQPHPQHHQHRLGIASATGMGMVMGTGTSMGMGCGSAVYPGQCNATTGKDDDFPPPPSPLSLTDSDWLDLVSLTSDSNFSDIASHGLA